MKIEAKSSNRKWIAVLAAIAVTVIVIAVFKNKSGRKSPGAEKIAALKNDPQATNRFREVLKNNETDFGLPEFYKEVESLRERFGPRINIPFFRYQLVDYLMIHCFNKYSKDNYAECVLAYLREAFPDLADELFDFFEKVQAYNEWLRKGKIELQSLPPEERMAAMWKKRYEILGKENALDIFRAQVQGEKIEKAYDNLNEMPEKASLNDKALAFVKNLNNVLGDKEFEKYMEQKRPEIMHRFLDHEVVQKDLSAMSPEERIENLSKVRSSLGMKPWAVDGMAKLDKERDKRWSTGEGYLNSRDKLTKQYSGSELEEKLDELREATFGKDLAETIKGEEKAGFYRFKHKRKYGLE